MRPQILALDEPTAGLDPRARRRLIALLQNLTTTMLVVGHDLDLILDVCGRAILLDRGQVAADGPAAEMLRDGALLESHGLELPLSVAGRA
jgi:cobalt/nickel transport system ATP-binding protein